MKWKILNKSGKKATLETFEIMIYSRAWCWSWSATIVLWGDIAFFQWDVNESWNELLVLLIMTRITAGKWAGCHLITVFNFFSMLSLEFSHMNHTITRINLLENIFNFPIKQCYCNLKICCCNEWLNSSDL